jgi:hypothetical protein
VKKLLTSILLCLIIGSAITPAIAGRKRIPVPEFMAPNKSLSEKHAEFLKAVGIGTVSGMALCGLVEYIFRNQYKYGLKFGGVFGALIGARLGAEAYGPQDSMLWHDITNIIGRLVSRVDGNN